VKRRLFFAGLGGVYLIAFTSLGSQVLGLYGARGIRPIRALLDGVKAVCLALQQAERYGTPMAQTLRVMSQENRDMRMSEAEKKAAALPPKLTVPMIVFFLPVLFVVILGPAAIKAIAAFS